jgi:hypothetical protein
LCGKIACRNATDTGRSPGDDDDLALHDRLRLFSRGLSPNLTAGA